MHSTSDHHVDITEHGRTGSIVYRELGGSLSFPWEVGGGDVVACIHVGTEAEWQRDHPWAADRRATILRCIAGEVVRQKAPNCTAEVDERTGWMNLRQRLATDAPRNVQRSAPVAPHASAAAWVGRYSRWRMKLGLAVLVITMIAAVLLWFKQRVLVIDPGKGTPIGLSVRTDTHIATLIQTLEPYTPSLDRNHGNDTYRYSLFLVPLDGSATHLIPIGGGFPANAMALAKVLGNDGRVLWFDANGVGGVDLRTFALLPAGRSPAPGAHLQGADTSPFPPAPDAFLAAGFIMGTDRWFGLHSTAEVEGEFAPKKFVRRVVRQEDAKVMRRFHRGTLEAPVDDKYHRILSMTPVKETEYLNAAFLRKDDRSEPLRLSDPDGALMIYTSSPGLKGTLMVARVDTKGTILWKVDTGIHRFNLQQILPGDRSMAFIGTRPMVPGKVSEPLLVIIDSGSGTVVTHSLWQ